MSSPDSRLTTSDPLAILGRQLEALTTRPREEDTFVQSGTKLVIYTSEDTEVSSAYANTESNKESNDEAKPTSKITLN